MLKRRERYMRVYSPATEDSYGEFLGRFPVSISYRTSEEVESDDLVYTNLRLSAYAERHRSPSGGYRRGMTLEEDSGSERYHVLVPVLSGRLWILKLERCMTNGDGEEEANDRIR